MMGINQFASAERIKFQPKGDDENLSVKAFS
jgi:hypothetical protein